MVHEPELVPTHTGIHVEVSSSKTIRSTTTSGLHNTGDLTDTVTLEQVNVGEHTVLSVTEDPTFSFHDEVKTRSIPRTTNVINTIDDSVIETDPCE